ncbi:protease SohB [Buchnera aphidicola (Melanaphis sacchari)]|uniref:Protease SohB n=1 Tax=Buchnera aphidicola (Melanaphis sacchari) TaxID=2173854 RepID=A0A2U8DGA2_9GAMM|nr:protease SohB [Buchnera aphidicola]AWH90505.1 protease SohB [Buchnera aphidicola (Melanaphis sacchari)]
MNLILNYGLFLLKTATFFVFVIAILLFYNRIKKRSKDQKKFKITLLENYYNQAKDSIFLLKMNKFEKKIWLQKKTKKNKEFLKNFRKKFNANQFLKKSKKTLFILDFKGDINATKVTGLRKEISLIIMTANKNDEVLLRLESSGGVVHGYGLAASQLQRLRKHDIHLIICIDKIAASGGYMMACVANRIVSAPFSIVGSIGVVAQLPNFYRLLKKNNIDMELHTAGDYKRTLTMFGNNTDLMRHKFRQELNATHNLFKQFIKEMRPIVNINEISNGEHWLGKIAFEKKLVDEINTSDDILMSKINEYNLLSIKFIYNKKRLFNLTDYIFKRIQLILKKLF